MGTPSARPKGELILLGIFGLFIASYLVDVASLPMDAKILPYVLALPLILLLLVCAGQAVLPKKKAKEGELPPLKEEEKPSEADEVAAPEEELPAPLGLGRTIVMGFVLYACIYLFGFYLGSGLMLLIWFVTFRKLTRTTLIITIATPLVLYLSFEVLMAYGLYEGLVIELLQR